MNWNYGNTPELYKEVFKKWNYQKRHDDQR